MSWLDFFNSVMLAVSGACFGAAVIDKDLNAMCGWGVAGLLLIVCG